MNGTAPGAQSPALPAREALLWLGLVSALSPILMDWVRHLIAEPRSAYAAVFLPLLLHLVWCDSRRAAPRPLALWPLVSALVFALVMVGGGVARYGRLALPVSVIGMGAWLGRPRPAVALLSLWIVPAPGFLMDALVRRLPESVPASLVEVGFPALALISGCAYYAAVLRRIR